MLFALAYKKFDRKLYEANDTKARKALTKLFDKTEYVIKPSAKKMAVDFEVFKDNELVGFAECEIKNVWKKDFQYDSLQIPERKRKYCLLNKPTVFFVFRKDLKQFMAVTSDDLQKSEVREVRNKYVSFGEMFFSVKLDKIISDIKKIKYE